MVINLWSATILIFIALSFFWSPQNPPTPCQMYKVAWSRVRSHQSPAVLWASCKQEPMESMALVPPAPLGLAHVDVFFIKSQYKKQKSSAELVSAWKLMRRGLSATSETQRRNARQTQQKKWKMRTKQCAAADKRRSRLLWNLLHPSREPTRKARANTAIKIVIQTHSNH